MTWALEILKIPTLIGSFYAKYITFDLKKYRRVIFHDTEVWCKIWRKTDLWFVNCHNEYIKFLPGDLKLSKLGLWRDPLNMHELKIYIIVMCHDNLKWCKEELASRFKIDMGNLTKFEPSTQKSQKCAL